MTTASKCLVILATVASIAFFAVISVGTFAGPNYADHMRDEQLSSQYIVSKTEAEKTTYSVQTRRKFLQQSPQGARDIYEQENVGTSSPVMAKVVVDTRSHLLKKQNEEIARLSTIVIPELTTKIAKFRSLRDADVQAMKNRLADLQKTLAENRATLNVKRREAADKAGKIVQTLTETKRRREEVSRYEQQVKELLTDMDRIVEQRKELDILIVRLIDEVARLENRHKKLIARGAKLPETITSNSKKTKSVGER